MTAWQMSSIWTSGRQGVPSLVILISLLVQANPARLLRTMSNRMRGLAPKAVALRKKTGEKWASASAPTSRSTNTLHLAYAVCGLGADASVRSPPSSAAPYTLQEEVYTKRGTPACLHARASVTEPRWLIS